MLNSKFINKFASKNLGLILVGTFVSNNIITLKVVEEDNMAPVLNHGPVYNDIVVVLRATKYHKNDIILYKNPNSGKESFGRLAFFNTDESLGSLASKVPSGHCWYHKFEHVLKFYFRVENDNPRSDEHDSNTFGPVRSPTITHYSHMDTHLRLEHIDT